MDDRIPDCLHCSNRYRSVLKCALPETLRTINEFKGFSKFEKGSQLFQAGIEAEGFYFLREGSVRAFSATQNGKEQTFFIRGPGDWVGFRDVVTGGNFSHTVTALEHTEACYITKELLSQILTKDPDLQGEILKQMALEWRDQERQSFSLGTKQVHGKLAELLLSFRKAASDADEIDLKVTREILASMIGTTTETLVRALTDFRVRGWIETERNTVRFKNIVSLKNLADETAIL